MSTARRLHVARLPEGGGSVELGPDVMRHARVLRLRVGDPVVLFDGHGHEADGTVEMLSEDRLRCASGPRRAAPARRVRTVLALGMPKGSKLDDIVRSCTELGVSAFHLFGAERSVARPDEERAQRRLDRLTRVAREAARQSMRADVPDLWPPVSLAEVVARVPVGAARLAFVVGAVRRVPEVLASLPAVEEAWVVVGPEGGLSAAEVRALEEHSFCAVGLGPTVLRVETAAPVAVAVVSHHLGALG